jgi:hypothetical protein
MLVVLGERRKRDVKLGRHVWIIRELLGSRPPRGKTEPTAKFPREMAVVVKATGVSDCGERLIGGQQCYAMQEARGARVNSLSAWREGGPRLQRRDFS